MAVDLAIDDFNCVKHVAYFLQHARSLPEQYKTMDMNRLTLLYFSISGLDLLGKLDEIDKGACIEYIYSFQSPFDDGGFYGYPKVNFQDPELDKANNLPHIANTYVALVMLLILGDDLSRVKREAVAASLQKWQLEDGSFCCVNCLSSLDSESDIRFVYCAASICYILDLWHAVDVEAMLQFICSSQSYDGAFGMGPGTESHGGCTYCAVAALAMLGHEVPQRKSLEQWCTARQLGGFQGRIEKDPDSCYSFWVGGTLQLLGIDIEHQSCARFLQSCESRYGGFQKFPHAPYPDLLHSYFSVCGLCLCGLLPPLDAMLGMSRASRDASEARRALRAVPALGKTWAQRVPSAVQSTGELPELPTATAINWRLVVAIALLLLSFIMRQFQ